MPTVRLLAAGFLTIIGLHAIGCEREPANNLQLTHTLLFIGPHAGDSREMAIRSAAAAVAGRNALLHYTYRAPADDSPEALVAELVAAVAAKPDVLVVFVREPELVIASLREAEGQIPHLVTVGTRPALPRLAAHVDLFEPDAAELLARNLQTLAAGGRSYVLVSRRAGELATNIRNRFMREARSQISMSLLSERGETDGEADADAVRALTTEFPNAALVVTLEPDAWLRSPPPLSATKGGAPDATRFATLGAPPALWPALRTGAATGLVGSLDGEAGGLAIELAWEAIITRERRETLLRSVAPELVTARSLDDFARRYAQAAHLPLAQLSPDSELRP